MRILVTGGAGYIGSHTCKELAEQGHAITVFDNLSTGHREMVQWGNFVHGDLLDYAALRRVLHERKIDGVIHFAGKIEVGESVINPGFYFSNNVCGTLSLLSAMRDEGVFMLVFSGTCAVYGQPESIPLAEDARCAPVSPYAESKLFIERMLADFERAHNLKYVTLRYFNAAGADFDGKCGEWHNPESHLIPRAIMATLGNGQMLQLFGKDYPTPDGTCIRDYIHVKDLARAHCAALDYLAKDGTSETVNLGTGKGFSVLEIMHAIESITGKSVPYRIAARRPGDPPCLIAENRHAREILGWQPQFSSLQQIISSAWQWHKQRMA